PRSPRHGTYCRYAGWQGLRERIFSRMQGNGLWAELIAQRFSKACVRLGLNRQRFTLDNSQFVPPVRPRAGAVQGQLF
ncbi:hypothetical protein ABTM48_20355, partial [Acinetobacter baumannii]